MTENVHNAAILVAEDNPTNRLALKALLSHFGQNADFVCNGQEAVSAASAEQYGLILMDLHMPIKDGFEATKAIRQREYGTGQHTPIVAVTALDPEPNKQKCIDAGMDDYICKPIDQVALKEALVRWLPHTTAGLLQSVLKVAINERTDNNSRMRVQALYGCENISDILDSFLSVTDKLLESLKSAIETRDLSTARVITHEVKGSSLAVSAQEMVTLAIALELAIRAENWIEVVKYYSALTAAFRHVTVSLRTPVGKVLTV